VRGSHKDLMISAGKMFSDAPIPKFRGIRPSTIGALVFISHFVFLDHPNLRR